jgi:hypothetical protein
LPRILEPFLWREDNPDEGPALTLPVRPCRPSTLPLLLEREVEGGGISACDEEVDAPGLLLGDDRPSKEEDAVWEVEILGTFPGLCTEPVAGQDGVLPLFEPDGCGDDNAAAVAADWLYDLLRLG